MRGLGPKECDKFYNLILSLSEEDNIQNNSRALLRMFLMSVPHTNSFGDNARYTGAGIRMFAEFARDAGIENELVSRFTRTVTAFFDRCFKERDIKP